MSGVAGVPFFSCAASELVELGRWNCFEDWQGGYTDLKLKSQIASQGCGLWQDGKGRTPGFSGADL